MTTRVANYGVFLSNISFEYWVHTALVYYGPEDGISLYLNGSLAGSDFSGSVVTFGESTGNVTLGREYTAYDMHYADVTMDELFFWNEALGAAVIQDIYNLH